MEEGINKIPIVLYVDDDFDNDFIDAMRSLEEEKGFRFESFRFESKTFDLVDFLTNPFVSSASVIIMDSKLYTKGSPKFFGEDLVLVLKSILHFCTFLLFTQEDSADRLQAFKKYDRQRCGTETASQYYINELWRAINEGIQKRRVMEELASGGELKTTALKGYLQRAKDELAGDLSYSTLTSEDIDELVREVKNIISK